jgi:hypothetical protein
MAKHFFYSRQAEAFKKDENGNKIAVMKEVLGEGDEQPTFEPIPGQFEKEIVTYIDSFNIDKVIRTHHVAPDQLVVLLDDGHEITDVVEHKLINPKKPPTQDNVTVVKGRVWVQSEILVKGLEEITALKAIL